MEVMKNVESEIIMVWNADSAQHGIRRMEQQDAIIRNAKSVQMTWRVVGGQLLYKLFCLFVELVAGTDTVEELGVDGHMRHAIDDGQGSTR